jgi:CPA2 family monovalent cation:H+ antiporter-2
VAITGLGELGRRVSLRCKAIGLPIAVIGTDAEALEELHARGIATAFGDPGHPDVLRAAGLAHAKIVVVTNASLADKMRICIAAREVNPRIAIAAISGTAAERAWLGEFGAAYICDALDEMTDALLRSIRSAL